MRSLARECVFKVLFSRLFNPNDEGLFDVLCVELNDSDKEFAKTLFEKVVACEEEYSNAISNLSCGFSLNRVFNADKCILMLAMAEIDCFNETDLPVIVDEACKLASKYSTEKSTDFVNGILASYAKGKR